MSDSTLDTSRELRAFRDANYNATVTSFRRLHEDLALIRVRHDAGPLSFEPGQYTVLGLGRCEPRVPGCQAEEVTEASPFQLIRRAYSISCPMIDANGGVIRATDGPDVEFYIALLRKAVGTPPALSPRLFAISEGQRIHMSAKCHGSYTLGDVRPTDNVLFLATGTGEAPHNAMLAELLYRGHLGRIASAVCTRYRRDLGYLGAHRRVEQLHANYRYLPVTTREPANVDRKRADFVGKIYLQNYFESGQLELDADVRLVPDGTHVFLCGNPAMIGVPHQTHDADRRYPKPVGMVELLEGRGFAVDRPHERGNIHFEKYW